MITGDRCGASLVLQKESKKAVTSRTEQALAKLDRFAFVGITERWSQSICVFSKLFPRPSGRPLPSFVMGKLRSSKDHRCEDAVKKVLRSETYIDRADEAIYAHAVDLFEKALHQFP